MRRRVGHGGLRRRALRAASAAGLAIGFAELASGFAGLAIGFAGLPIGFAGRVAAADAVAPVPPPAAGRAPEGPARGAVAAFLMSWQRAWERQQPDEYFDHYASDCIVDGRDRAAFEAHKRRLFALAGDLAVQLGDLRVEAIDVSGEALVRATLDQDYSSSRLSDFGRKELILRADPAGFVIVRESWTMGMGRIERPLADDAVTPAPPGDAPPGDAAQATPPGDAPLLGEGYAPPVEIAAGPRDGEDPLRMDPLLGPSPILPQFDYGLPTDSGDRRVVEEIVATINGEILTRTQLVQRIGWYEATLVEQDPPDLEEQIRHLAESALDATITRWLILQEARARSADVEGFWRQWLSETRRQVGAENLEDFSRLLEEQGTSLAELKEQVVETEVPSVFLQQQIAEAITFTEAELEAWFDAHRGDYQRSQEVTLRQILIPVTAGESASRARAAADAAIASLREGSEWCDVHDIYGSAGAHCGEIGTLMVADLLPELRETAAGLPVGAVSRPVLSTQGVHVLQVTARAGFDPVAFADVRERVLRDARAEAYEKRSAEYVADLRARSQIDINPRYPHADARQGTASTPSPAAATAPATEAATEAATSRASQ